MTKTVLLSASERLAGNDSEGIQMLWGYAGNGVVEGTRPHREDQVQGQRLVYSKRCGRVVLDNVTVQNRGVDWAHAGNIYWQHKVSLPLGMSWQPVNCFMHVEVS